MKGWISLVLALALAIACGAASAQGGPVRDGVYRGFYYADGAEQVAVQMEIKDGCFQHVGLRSVNNCWDGETDERVGGETKTVLLHFSVLCAYLEGKSVGAVNDLYAPEKILEAQGLSACDDVQYGKLISAIWDAINRRPFKLVDTSKLPEAAPYEDGVYTGKYEDDDGQQVVLEFVLEGNRIVQIEYLELKYKGVDYLRKDAPHAVAQMAGQFEELIDYLVGKDIAAVNDLYLPGEIATDTDVSSAATLRSPKIISAIWEGLNQYAYRLD